MSEVPRGMITVDEFAKLKGLDASKVIDMVRDGFYVGRKVGEDWFIDASESTLVPGNTSTARGSCAISGKKAANEVVVKDIQMTFPSMVVFMVKWVIASIPAFIILFILFYSSLAILGGTLLGATGSR